MYNYSPKTCLIKDLDGKIYDIVDLWLGNKTPVNMSNIQYDFSPKTCLLQNVDGTMVNIIDVILSVVRGTGIPSEEEQIILNEVIKARDNYPNLKTRLDTENKMIYDTINSKSYLHFEGTNDTIIKSRPGYTKDMTLEGRTYANLSEVTFDNKNDFLPLSNNVALEEKSLWFQSLSPTSERTDMFAKKFKNLKPNTKYTLVVNVYENTLDKKMYITSTELEESQFIETTTISPGFTGEKRLLITTKTNVTNAIISIRSFIDLYTTGRFKFNYYLLEGDYTPLDLYVPPYFERVTSVGEKEGKINLMSHGKNHFNIGDLIPGDLTPDTGEVMPDISTYAISKNYIRVKPNQQYNLQFKPIINSYDRTVYFYDHDKKIIGYNFSSLNFSTPNGCYYIKFKIEDARNTGITDLILNEGGATSFTPYEENVKEVVLPYSNGLKGLLYGAKDTIVMYEGKTYVKQRIEKYILNGSEEWQEITGREDTNTFYAQTPLESPNGYVMCDGIVSYTGDFLWNNDDEGIGTNKSTHIHFRINRNRLETQDIAGLKKWLSHNPLSVYYELKTPREYLLMEVDDLDLRTYGEITHILTDNEIAPVLSFEAPVDIGKIISSLNMESRNLKKNIDIEVKTLENNDKNLQNGDNVLNATDLDLDFRLYELESMTQQPTNVSLTKSRFSSPYTLIKRCINTNLYDKMDMEYKINRYYAGGRITTEEKEELLNMIK